jgi:hypothetical protein
MSSPRFVLAVENKVLAREHGEQTRRYWDWLSKLAPVSTNPGQDQSTKPGQFQSHLKFLSAGLFLSPSGFPPASGHFKALSYLELLSCFLEDLRATPTREEELVLSGYVKTLAAGILRSELRAISQGGGYVT